MSTSTSSASGSTATAADEVWIRPWDSVTGTRWTRCGPALVLEAEPGVVALDQEGDLVEPVALRRAGGQHLDLPALGRRVAGVHVVEVLGEEVGLLAALGPPDLHDHVAAGVGVAGHQQQPELLLEPGHVRPRPGPPRPGPARARRPTSRSPSPGPSRGRTGRPRGRGSSRRPPRARGGGARPRAGASGPTDRPGSLSSARTDSYSRSRSTRRSLRRSLNTGRRVASPAPAPTAPAGGRGPARWPCRSAEAGGGLSPRRERPASSSGPVVA